MGCGVGSNLVAEGSDEVVVDEVSWKMRKSIMRINCVVSWWGTKRVWVR